MSMLIATSNRERAILIWITILFVGFLFNSNIRKSLKNVLSALVHRKILQVIVALFLYFGLQLIATQMLHRWNAVLLKDSLVWLVITAFAMLFNYNEAYQRGFYQKAIKDSLKGTVLVEFVVNFYVYNLVVELIIVPVVVILTLTYEYSKILKGFGSVTKFLESVLSIVGIFLLITTFYKFTQNPLLLIYSNSIIELLMPVILTLLFLPFIYILSLISLYENVFIRIESALRANPHFIGAFKRNVFMHATISVSTLSNLSVNYVSKLLGKKSREDLSKMLTSIPKK